MTTDNEILLWQETNVNIVPTGLSSPADIAACATQLTQSEKAALISSFQSGGYEMATLFVWTKSMAALKRELGTLGVSFLAEMLGRQDIDEFDNVLEVISEREAIRLAGELGILTPTGAMRLRHSQELVSHFAQRESNELSEQMEATEAVQVLLNCVKGILSKPQVKVAKRFAEFRQELETVTFESDDQQVEALLGSPYFFIRLAISVLLSGIRSHSGAKLEHCLANLNLLLPLVWTKLRDPEKFQVGTTYVQVYADGLQTQTVGLKKALLKVKGFDFVPENVRSQTFLKAADAIIKAHEGINNYYTELGPVQALEKLGTVIPAPALGACLTALLCVRLGNSYGRCWAVTPIADTMLKKQGLDRWNYYFNKVLPGDLKVLEKLQYDLPQTEWFTITKEILPLGLSIESPNVHAIVAATFKMDHSALTMAAQRLVTNYYWSQQQSEHKKSMKNS